MRSCGQYSIYLRRIVRIARSKLASLTLCLELVWFILRPLWSNHDRFSHSMSFVELLMTTSTNPSSPNLVSCGLLLLEQEKHLLGGSKGLSSPREGHGVGQEDRIKYDRQRKMEADSGWAGHMRRGDCKQDRSCPLSDSILMILVQLSRKAG